MEFQPPAIGSAPLSNGGARPDTGEWPAVPPAPTPVKPTVPAAAPQPPLIRAGVATVPPGPPAARDDSPTVAIPAPVSPLLQPTREAPLISPERRERRTAEIWQSRFAYVTGGVILAALLLLTLPLWIVVFRLTGTAATSGDGPDVSSLVALCMLLMGAFLTGGAAWMIIVEMRARVRIVDALAGLGERDPYQPFDAPFDPAQLGPGPDEMNQPVTAPIPATAMPGAVMPGAMMPGAMGPGRVGHAHPATASHQRLSSLTGMLREFGQLPAQVGMLAIALALFLGATVLNL